MKRKTASKKVKSEPPALRALRRAARRAVDHAKRTGTPAYVLQGDEVVNIAAKRLNSNKAAH